MRLLLLLVLAMCAARDASSIGDPGLDPPAQVVAKTALVLLGARP